MQGLNTPQRGGVPPVTISWNESIDLIDQEVSNYNLHRRPTTRNDYGRFTHPKITPAASPAYRMILSLLRIEQGKMLRNHPETYQAVWAKECDGVPMTVSYGQFIKRAYRLDGVADNVYQNKKRCVRNYFKRFLAAGFLLNVQDAGRGRMRLVVAKKWLVYAIPAGFFSKKLSADNQLVTHGLRKNLPPSLRNKRLNNELDVMSGVRYGEQDSHAPAGANNLFKEVTVEQSQALAKFQAPPPISSAPPPKEEHVCVGNHESAAAAIMLASYAKENLYAHWDWTTEQYEVLKRSMYLLLLQCLYRNGQSIETMKPGDYTPHFQQIFRCMNFVREQVSGRRWKLKYSPNYYFSSHKIKSESGKGGRFLTVLFEFHEKHQHAKKIWMQGRVADMNIQEVRTWLDFNLERIQKRHLSGDIYRPAAIAEIQAVETKLKKYMTRKRIPDAQQKVFVRSLRSVQYLIPNS